MRRRTIAFSIMLCAVVLVKLCLPGFAENAVPTGTPYRITTSFMEGRDEMVACELTADEQDAPAVRPSDTQDAKGETPPAKTDSKEFPFSTDYGKGQTARAQIALTATGREMSDSDWAEIKTWLSKLMALAIPSTEGMNPQSIAERAYEAFMGARAQATPDESGALPLYADPAIALTRVSVTAPYYPELKRGSRDEDVRALQERLRVLGYLEGAADGQFGKMTEAAIMDAEREMRALEQKAIDKMKPAPTPEPTPGVKTTDSETEPTDPENDSAQKPETPEPTPEPTPATAVDGVADLNFQIRLYGEEFPLIDGPLQKGSDPAQITRLQRRLIELGCLLGNADGDFGGNTRRAVRIFQHYNGLPETGVADEAVLRAIFSKDAKAPVNPLLAAGSKGDAVKKLQSRLALLGFTTRAADGSYGASTKAAVENLQAYMRESEIRAAAQATQAQTAGADASDDLDEDEADGAEKETLKAPADPAFVPTVEINGIADPLLLDAFYAEDFPEIPAAQKNGANNLDVTRIQRRLIALEYMYYTMDGAYGDGTEEAVRAFQKRNGLSQDGVAGQETLRLLFSSDAKPALKPYMLKISIDKQRVYAYGLDENEEHTVLVRTMKCSTGLSDTPTPRGTFKASTGPGARWHYFKKFSCWAQYAYYIEGDILFHSVLYNQKGGPVTSSSVRNLGSRASHGCVRLAVEDAKWIWENCPKNTKVVVY